MITVLHNNNCSKSRAVLEFLDENGMDLNIVDITQNPPKPDEMKELLVKMELGVHDLIRKDDPFFKENFSGKVLADDEWLQVLHDYPELIQRPILIRADLVRIGRPLDNAREFLL